ncbi:MAG: glycosyl transferase [Planctomycetota bacterium]
MSTIHVFTSAACNYVPKVRALVASIRRHQPDWRIHLALADEMPAGIDLSREGFDEVHPLAALDIPDHRGWAFCHRIVELATAIKPFLLRQLLARPDCRGVVYLDPDTVLFSPLVEVDEALAAANVALTPHLTVPDESLEGVMDNEIASLKHGIYNLGFLAVAATDTGRDFAAWWADRCYHFCRDAIPHGLFTDQRWIDLVPAFFPGTCILRSSRLNVASWNVSRRRVTGSAPGDVLVDGEPLGFYHFTGFDSGAHREMAWKHAADQPAVQGLITWYAAAIADFGRDPLSQAPWAFGSFSDGTPVPAAARIVYRERVDLQAAFPDPFQAGGFKRWWESQGRIEYPILFDEATVADGLQSLFARLSPGFRGGAAGSPRAGLRGVLTRAVAEPGYRSRIARRAWEVLRTEGVAGVLRRLAR